MSRATAYRNLPKLASYGMAKKLPDGWILGNRAPDDVPYDMGWIEDNSKVNKRAEQFAQEREAHKMELDTYARLHPKRTVKMMTPTQQLARLHQSHEAQRQEAPPTDRTVFGELMDIGKLLQDKLRGLSRAASGQAGPSDRGQGQISLG